MPEAMPKREAVRERRVDRTWRGGGGGGQNVSWGVKFGGELTRVLCAILSGTKGEMERARSSGERDILYFVWGEGVGGMEAVVVELGGRKRGGKRKLQTG